MARPAVAGDVSIGSAVENRRTDWRRVALGLLYSKQCAGCGAEMDSEEEGHLCWDCRAGLPLVQRPFCEVCGDPVAGEIGGEYVCGACAKKRPAFAWARSAMRYDGLAREFVTGLKYRESVWMAEEMAGWLEALWGTCPEDRKRVGAIVAVPLHFPRYRERGYNQAAVLAEGLSRRTGIPFRRTWLRRTRPTPTQTRLGAAARRANVAGAFEVPWWRRRAVEGMHVAVVDDVMTTGATMSACAAALRAGGAASVVGISVARGG